MDDLYPSITRRGIDLDLRAKHPTPDSGPLLLVVGAHLVLGIANVALAPGDV